MENTQPDTVDTQAPLSPQDRAQQNVFLKNIPVLFISLFMLATGFTLGYYIGREQQAEFAEQYNASDLPLKVTQTGTESSLPATSPTTETTQKIAPPTTEMKEHSIPDARLTFSAPADMEVTTETQRNVQTNEPTTITMYIQKNMTQPSTYYQLYGLYQLETPQDLEGYKADLIPASVKDTTISGFPAVEGQVKGERNRFVTYVQTNRGFLSLYTAEPTPENKAYTDQILSTFKIAQ